MNQTSPSLISNIGVTLLMLLVLIPDVGSPSTKTMDENLNVRDDFKAETRDSNTNNS